MTVLLYDNPVSGGFDLEPYPAVCGWLGRVAARPGVIPITA